MVTGVTMGVLARQAGVTGADRRNTVVLVGFTAVTNLADGVTKVALPLMAAGITDSPGQVAAVALTLTLPWLLVALHVGVLVDRYDRRALLWLANVVRLVAVGGLLYAVAADAVTLPVLYAGGAALGVAEVVALTTAAAIVPAAVSPPGRERANAWVTAAETVCNEFCGPFVGGLLVAAGAAVALGTTAGAFAAAMVVLLLLTGRFRPRPGGTAPAGSVHARIGAGLRTLWRQRLLRVMALSLTVLCACWGAWLALMPLVATTVMGLDAQGYGVLLSALGVGGLAGALTVRRVNRLLGRRWALFADLVGTAAMVAAPAVTTELWVVAAAAFAGGMGGTLWSVNARTLSQQLVPDEMMGRYNAAARLFSWGALPLGAGLGGLLAEVAGLRATFWVCTAATLALVVPFLRTLTPAALAEAEPPAAQAGTGVAGCRRAVRRPSRRRCPRAGSRRDRCGGRTRG